MNLSLLAELLRARSNVFLDDDAVAGGVYAGRALRAPYVFLSVVLLVYVLLVPRVVPVVEFPTRGLSGAVTEPPRLFGVMVDLVVEPEEPRGPVTVPDDVTVFPLGEPDAIVPVGLPGRKTPADPDPFL